MAIGMITFGFGVNASTLRVDRPMGDFAVTNAAIGWSAWLKEVTGGETVNVMYVSEGADGHETFIHQELLVVASPLLTILANTSDLGAIVGAKPGLYCDAHPAARAHLGAGNVSANGDAVAVGG